MQRLRAILVLLAVTFVSSSPAWALVVADHSCCATANVAEQAKPQSSVAGKHAHCSAMAAKIAAGTPSSGQITAAHACSSCALSVLTRPQGSAGVDAQATIARIPAVVKQSAEPLAVVSRERTLQAERGPPSFIS